MPHRMGATLALTVILFTAGQGAVWADPTPSWTYSTSSTPSRLGPIVLSGESGAAIGSKDVLAANISDTSHYSGGAIPMFIVRLYPIPVQETITLRDTTSAHTGSATLNFTPPGEAWPVLAS